MVNERLRQHPEPGTAVREERPGAAILAHPRGDCGSATVGLGDLINVVKNLSIIQSKQSIYKLGHCELRFVPNEF
jgi:hypothetical protein